MNNYVFSNQKQFDSIFKNSAQEQDKYNCWLADQAKLISCLPSSYYKQLPVDSPKGLFLNNAMVQKEEVGRVFKKKCREYLAAIKAEYGYTPKPVELEKRHLPYVWRKSLEYNPFERQPKLYLTCKSLERLVFDLSNYVRDISYLLGFHVMLGGFHTHAGQENLVSFLRELPDEYISKGYCGDLVIDYYTLENDPEYKVFLDSKYLSTYDAKLVSASAKISSSDVLVDYRNKATLNDALKIIKNSLSEVI